MGLEDGVNTTVGLPVARTSVDHGTAFDIAGTGRADERSMLEAMHQAGVLAPRRAAGSVRAIGRVRFASAHHAARAGAPACNASAAALLPLT